jgi:hypothetical protein
MTHLRRQHQLLIKNYWEPNNGERAPGLLLFTRIVGELRVLSQVEIIHYLHHLHTLNNRHEVRHFLTPPHYLPSLTSSSAPPPFLFAPGCSSSKHQRHPISSYIASIFSPGTFTLSVLMHEHCIYGTSILSLSPSLSWFIYVITGFPGLFSGSHYVVTSKVMIQHPTFTLHPIQN